MNTNTHRAPLALAIVALFAMTLVPISGAETAAQEQAPFVAYRPGAPGEHAWRMWKLDVTEHAKLQFQVEFLEIRCPTVMRFALMQGSPGNALQYVGLTYYFVGGQTGAQVHAVGPVTVQEGLVTHEGEEECNMAPVSFTFKSLPVGTIYLLAMHAGLPVRADFVGTITQGQATVVGESFGDDAFYHIASDFDGGAHAAVWGPPDCRWPSLDPTNGVCDPCCRLPGGFTGGGEVNVARSKRITFGHRPEFSLYAVGQNLGNATVTDAEGRVMYTTQGTVWAANTSVHPFGTGIATSHPYDYPSGEYSFDIRHSATVGLPRESAPHWILFGADLWFPEEMGD